MNRFTTALFGAVAAMLVCVVPASARAALTLTAGSNATTTPNVATSITGFQIVGPSTDTTPVKLRATSGTLSLSTVSGVTMSGNNSSTVNLSGTVANLNLALATLKYTRGSTGTDTLEVSLVNPTEVFFTDNGHLYQFIAGSFTWSQAQTAAAARTAYGASGYLATITSLAENSFVYTRISGDGWLGTTDEETEKTWKWVTGPETGLAYFQENPSGGGGSAISGRYNGWADGEPNDFSSGEDCGYMYASQGGAWNDFPCSAQQGYVVEFGGIGGVNPTVVAQNISIVTADVPAVTSLSPANGSATAATTTNLTIGFSKTVTKQTGSIVIYKTADNSVVETISAAGSQVSGSGTNSITIDPAANLTEGVQYYVIIPTTAFKDSSNNFFDGILASSTWSFTVPDVTAPVITNVGSSVLATSSVISWTTDEAASTKVVYSTGSSFASTTSEADTSSRVTSHSISLPWLASCTTYNFRVVSRDASLNSATTSISNANTFTTTGCIGNAAPTSATTTSVTVAAAATSTLTETGRTLTVATPANFTATSSTVVIQIRSQEAPAVLGTLGIPASVSSAASFVFDVKALINSSVELDSFDHPVTITYAYTDADISGLNENTLSMYHYHDGAWDRLEHCSVDTAANIITCDTPNFSIFGIFGSALSTGSNTASAGMMGGGSVQDQVRQLVAMGYTAQADALKAQYPWLFVTAPQIAIAQTAVRDLEIGTAGEDVRSLQRILNAIGYSVAASGAGSPGHETATFGSFTKKALAAYQKANGIRPAVGYFGPVTREHMKRAGMTGLWW